MTEKNSKAPRVTVPQSVKTVLRAKMVAHNKKSKYKVTMAKLEAVYRRGIGAYYGNPSSVRGNVSSARQWGIARVNAWLKGVNGRFPRSAFDLDLFPAGHPRKPKKAGSKAENVKKGDYVSWSVNKDPDPPSIVHGIVERIVRSGVVNVGQEKYEASDDKPVAVMRVYAQVDGGHKRTDRQVARYFSQLRKISPWEKSIKTFELKAYVKEYEILQDAWINYFTNEYRKVLSDERRRILNALKSASNVTQAQAKIDTEITLTEKISIARFKEVNYSLLLDFGGRILDIYAPEKGYGSWTPNMTKKIEVKQTRQEIINRGFYPNRTESPVIGGRTPQRLLYNRTAIGMVDDSLITLFATLSATQRKNINRYIRKAAEGGMDYLDLVNEIEKKLGDGELSRARLIARTEVRKMSSFAQQQGALASTKIKKKRWVSLNDTWVRDWHRSANGQTKKMDEQYSVGGETVMYPGQGSGKNSANCRCTEVYLEV